MSPASPHLRPLACGADTPRRLYSLQSLEEAQPGCIARLPLCLRVLVENVLRHQGRSDVGQTDLQRLLNWQPDDDGVIAVPFHPARVLMQDYTGIPTFVDLAALRDAMQALGQSPQRINPQIPVDLVIDHSLIVDQSGHAGAMHFNLKREYERNAERYRLAKWATQSFDKLRVVPPGNGILHQINIERIAQVVRCSDDPEPIAFPDTMVGTDSHSTMVNGIGVLGWGVGGIEAEAAMLGLPVVVPLKRVMGVKLSGRLRPGVTSTDLVLALTRRLREFKVVESLVEFFGPSLDSVAVTDRVTIANMAPEYGSTCAFFPIDDATLKYLATTGRSSDHIALVKAYAKAQGLWRDDTMPEPEYSAVISFDLDEVEACVAGPRRPQDLVPLAQVPANFSSAFGSAASNPSQLSDGSVVIAAITSCTNTSNPAVMLSAGLLARNARARGLKMHPWVKTSLTPGSRVVGAYLSQSGLQNDLDALGFHVAGYGCGTCGGNSGRLDEAIEQTIESSNLQVCAVLSGNRNFEARIHPLARANYLMSPPLVVAYALAGNIGVNLLQDPLGHDPEGRPVYLREIWPDERELHELMRKWLTAPLFNMEYQSLFDGDEAWRALEVASSPQFTWDPASTYIKRPPYLDDFQPEAASIPDISGARPLLILGDSTTTDHISPVGDIALQSPAGRFLQQAGVPQTDFNAYGSRRANHEVMVRGTFANIRLRNAMADGAEGGVTRHHPDGERMDIFDAAQRYAEAGTPLVIIAGKEYGTGSSRDWAAKGTRLLGVRAVIAESFERIHRSNLIMMGVLPLQFLPGDSRSSLALNGSETFDILDMASQITPSASVRASIRRADGSRHDMTLICRLDTVNEQRVWASGGMMPFVLRKLLRETTAA